MTTVLILSLISLGISGAARETSPTQSVARNVTVGERALRRHAKARPAPAYPARAASNKVEGLVVARVVVATTGLVERLDVLEAADESFAKSVTETVTKWAFNPIKLVDSAEPLRMTGKLTFYFRIVKGKPSVLEPSEKEPTGRATDKGVLLRELTESDLARGLPKDAYLIDVRGRDDYRLAHDKTAMNIPSDELLVRAPFELDARRLVVIDCRAQSLSKCRHTAESLGSLGFRSVAIIDR